MKKKEIWFSIGGVVVGVMIALLFRPQVGSWGMMQGVNRPGNLNSGQIGRTMGLNLDQHFIEQMIPHHDGAIAMAKLALVKAAHPEIKTLAQTIIEAQEKEIQDMQGWYKNWFGRDVKEQDAYSYGMMGGGGMMSSGGMHMGGQDEIKALENASDFDKAFIESMIPHHQLAIMMAQMLKAGTDRPEMLSLAENIIESQTTEIEQMQDWYQSWYK